MFPTQEMGSIPKPRWYVKAYRGLPLTDEDFHEVRYWGSRLGIEDHDRLVRLLRETDSSRKRDKVRRWAVIYAIRFLESTGLDRVYTGEVLRVEMYEHVASKICGFRRVGRVQSVDNRYYEAFVVGDKISRMAPVYLQEFKIAREVARKELKIPIAGPFTLADWTLNEYYARKLLRSSMCANDVRHRARRDLALDITRKILRPEVKELIANGATWIQVDEPAVTAHPNDDDMKVFVEAFNMLTKGFSAKFSLHNCQGRYDVLSRYVVELKNCHQLALEFANRDSLLLGTEEEDRPGYRDLRLFEQNGYTGNYGIGVLHVLDFTGPSSMNAACVDRTLIESPELVRDRLIYATKVVGNPYRISVNPDCGLRTRRNWKTVMMKLSNMVEGSRLARRL
ncbi:MAG: hypothetical protein ACUVQ8_02630 [Nitrososphaeria archaeon]